ncbi:MAG: radical SAM family heme chaperone HemW [Clostridia bacterium]|nr:radical SAM family heme chaperone HemW [Clostridia bacterium]
MNHTVSVYIHIPLCIKKCAYCDFASYPGRLPQQDAYIDAVCREIRAQAAFFGRRRVATVFLGGGTPTLLTAEQLSRIMDALRECFDLLPDAEITMEGNPGTLSPDRLAAYRASGVNRLSLGVQSMDDGLLAAIGRIHTAEQAEEAVRMARGAGFDNLNLDLMYGLPGQTPAQWESTLRAAIALGPEHLSCYSLILEEGTLLHRQVEEGSCAPLPDEDALDEMDAITARLTAQAGYAQYEVSNYARPGRECRHNIVYWECLPYLGVGCAAHGDMDGRRYEHTVDFAQYLEDCDDAACLNSAEGNNTLEERMFERAMMGLRMVRGMDAARFERDFGRRAQDVWPRTMEKMTRMGLIDPQTADDAGVYNERIRLTPRGMQVMNGVLVEMMEEQEKGG